MDQIEKEDFQDLILCKVKHLDEELERGAYGRVYKIKHKDKICVAKQTYLFVTEEAEKEVQKTIELFLRECQRYSKLTPRPNLVALLGVCYPEGDAARMQLPVMVMEVMGGNLKSFVKNQSIPIDTKFSIITDVAFGLYHLHSQSPPIVHCDLSPNSILLTDRNVAAISDFGVYKIMRAGLKCNLENYPEFMPPEAGDGAGLDSHPSVDIFAFAGIILYIFTQQWPELPNRNKFDPKTKSMIFLSEIKRRVKYLDMMTEESAVLKPLIKECLDMDPDARPFTVDIHERIMNKGATLSQNIVQRPNDEKEQQNHSDINNEEKQSVAQFYKQICVLDTPDPDRFDRDRFLIYTLKPDSKNKITAGVFEHIYNSSTLVEQQELQPEKVVMVVGATGKGKSTLINRMINHIFGIQCNDEFRFQLVVEDESSDETKSQTQDITKYVIYKSQLLYKLIIIDTPGFGDTGGEEEDEKKLRKIKNLFISGTIISIDAICLVTYYNSQRLTSYEKHVLETMTKIFSKNVEENIYIIATICDDTYDRHEHIKDAPALKSIKAAGIPFKKCFPFNNKDIYNKPQNQTDSQYWETSATSFKLFFEELDKTIPISIQLSKKILQERHTILHAKLPDFVRKLKISIHVIDEHKENLRAIEMKLKNPDKNFTHVTKMEKEVMEDIKEQGVFCTKCVKCNKVCHDPCDISADGELYWCDTISWFNWDFRIYCTVCPEKCSWRDHKRYKQRPVRRTTHVTVDNESLKQKYLKEKSDEKMDMVKSCEDEMVSAYGDLLKDLKSIQDCLDFINNECLSKVPNTLEQYLNDIIEKETKASCKEDGYLKRINFLVHLITNIKKGNTYEKFKEASNKNKLQQAKRCFQEFTS